MGVVPTIVDKIKINDDYAHKLKHKLRGGVVFIFHLKCRRL